MEKPPETGTKVVGCIAARQAAQSGTFGAKKKKLFAQGVLFLYCFVR